MAKLTVHRKGYARRAYTANRGGKKVKVSAARVKPSTFSILDRGKPGRGPKVVPPLERGALGGSGFFDLSIPEQKKIVFNRAKKMGERKVVGELRALQVFFKSSQPKNSRRALELSKQVAGSFRGRQRVEHPRGLSRKH
ncbi:MAG TPA: hypothetical protein VJP79_09650 [Nitrososphaera sp.]|nr:hypothetical protein [Nitrososphaera sp.]